MGSQAQLGEIGKGRGAELWWLRSPEVRAPINKMVQVPECPVQHSRQVLIRAQLS